MDIADKAVDNERNISKISGRNPQTWEGYETAIKGKKVFLFGAGAYTEKFFQHYKGEKFILDGVIDNSREKWGKQLDDVVLDSFRSGKGELSISGPEILEQYSPDQVAVLITSVKYYKEILQQLKGIGINNSFVLVIMETNRRKAEFFEECCKERISDKKVVFYSFGTYSDHGKYISEQLMKLRNDLDIVWIIIDLSAEVPEWVRIVPVTNWKKVIYEMATAKVWVFNIEVPEYIKKREGQIFVEAKHWAGVTLKKCYLDSSTISEAPSYNNWRRNGKMMDYMLTGSEFDTEFCRRAFEFENEAVQIGSPRSDAVFHGAENKVKVCKYYGIDVDKKLLLYAPTFRFCEGSCYQQRAPHIELDFEVLREALKERWGAEWRILLRLHPGVARESKNINTPEYVVDVSGYSDSQELAAAADVMISDYSSIMFEPAFVKNPVFLFAPDRESYIDKEYDLLMEYDSLPFTIAESNDELMRQIQNFRQSEYEEKLDKFMKKYGVCEDGHASERAAGFISKLLGPSMERNVMIPGVTIIMPSLNVADYIRPCIESVLGQTMTEIEIIVVDAGSTDGTMEILEEYAQKDSRMRIVRSDVRSYGYQLNKGIGLARGEYVGIVETDDVVETDMFEKLYRVASDTEVDYVKGTAEGFFTSLVGDDVRIPIKIFSQEQYEACQGAIEISPCKTPDLVLNDYYVWDGIYRRDFIQGIRLNESKGAAFQDIGFIAQVHYQAGRAVYLNELVYHYRRNSENSSCGNKNVKAFQNLNQEYTYVDRLFSGRSKEWRAAIAAKMFRQIMRRFWTMACSEEFWEESVLDMQRLKERVETAISDGILKNSSLTETEWFQAMCFCGSPRLLYNACEKVVHDKINEVQNIIEEISGREAVIFGCGKLGQFLHILLGNQKQVKIAAYCDNQGDKPEKQIQGIKVFKPETAISKYPKAKYIIANRLCAEEMKKQLCNHGVNEKDILLYTSARDMMLIERFLG